MPKYFTRALEGARLDQDVISFLVRRFLPKLHKHLAKLEVDLALITFQWLMTIFIGIESDDVAARIFDNVVINGRTVLYRVVLAKLAMAQRRALRATSFEEIMDIYRDTKNSDEDMEEERNNAKSSLADLDDEDELLLEEKILNGATLKRRRALLDVAFKQFETLPELEMKSIERGKRMASSQQLKESAFKALDNAVGVGALTAEQKERFYNLFYVRRCESCVELALQREAFVDFLQATGEVRASSDDNGNAVSLAQIFDFAAAQSGDSNLLTWSASVEILLTILNAQKFPEVALTLLFNAIDFQKKAMRSGEREEEKIKEEKEEIQLLMRALRTFFTWTKVNENCIENCAKQLFSYFLTEKENHHNISIDEGKHEISLFDIIQSKFILQENDKFMKCFISILENSTK